MDKVSPETRSRNMRRIKSTGMRPEVFVRKLVYALGFRYRLHVTKLPGRPDLVFSSRKKIIFVHGCFWHQHEDPQCRISHRPRSNLDYWAPKLTRTKTRDLNNLEKLSEMGWSSLVVWECQLKDTAKLASVITGFLKG
ncbi:MAG: DNA mismatch endonuclease Vsr [Desulfarculus sp.]|nr:DNA mismatch endonuclease Vsr [Desulfarculus sp.]